MFLKILEKEGLGWETFKIRNNHFYLSFDLVLDERPRS